MNKNQFESLWVECNFNNDPTNKNRQIINISYNPSKSLIDPFLEELSTSIDIAIVENKPITLMGDFNIIFFNHKERQCLETITIPYGFHILNTTEPTRIGPTSKSLVDYIISDLPMIEGAVTYVSDTPLRTLKKTEVDHRATSAITNIKMKPQARVTIKEIFDKRNYRPEVLRNHLSYSDWSNFYNQKCAEGMFSAFTDIFEIALRKCVQKRKVFIRNDKKELWLHKKWITAETMKLYDKMRLKMDPNDMNYQKVHNQFLDNFEENRFQDQLKVFNNLESDKDKWNFMNEARNCKKTKTEINSLRNSLGDLVTDQTKIANLLNYRFSKLGDYLGKQKPYTENSHDSKTSAPFTFHPISLYECKRHLKSLNKNKPIGPSNIPAWALKDCLNIIAEPLCFLINAFIEESRFPNHLKSAFVIPIFKKR